MKQILLITVALICRVQTFAQNTPNDSELYNEQEVLVKAQDAQGTSPNASSNNLLWWFALPITGVIIGYIIAKKTTNNNEIEVEEENTPPVAKEEFTSPKPTKAKAKANVNITQLKQKYDKLREDNKVLKHTIAELKGGHKILKEQLDIDIKYYKTAFQNIVLPLQKAIDAGNHAEIFKLLTIAALQYSAITREKLSKRQNYDITNIQTLRNEPSDHNNYPILTKDTPTDKTPANLRKTISILQQLGVKDLDNYIIHGYKIKDL